MRWARQGSFLYPKKRRAYLFFPGNERASAAARNPSVIADNAEEFHILKVANDVILHVRSSCIGKAVKDGVVVELCIQSAHRDHIAVHKHHGIDPFAVALVKRTNASVQMHLINVFP